MVPDPSHPGRTAECVVEARWFHTVAILCCSGEVDLSTAPVLEQHIATVLNEKPTALVVDLTGVHFFASAGMGVLIAAHDSLTPGVAFAVVADGATGRPLKLMGLDDVLNLHPTLDSVLVRLKPAVPPMQRGPG
jgi:anti-sigma B factor antagonist